MEYGLSRGKVLKESQRSTLNCHIEEDERRMAKCRWRGVVRFSVVRWRLGSWIGSRRLSPHKRTMTDGLMSYMLLRYSILTTDD